MKPKTYKLADLNIDINQISKSSLEVVKKLTSKKFTAYLVGGAVRDLLLGKNPKDFDVVTNARPHEIKRLFKRAFIIGRRFKLVHVRIEGDLVDVSTFRKTANSSNNNKNSPLIVDNTYGDVTQDVQRRDLTVNALLLDPKKKVILDYMNGIEDLSNRILRVIGDPETRYVEDPVRMVRILRLAAKSNCTIATESLQPIKRLTKLLDDVPDARLLDEFIKIMNSDASRGTIQLMIENNVINAYFPHLKKFKKKQMLFIYDALSNNDHRIRKNLRNSISFLLSAIYWPLVQDEWQEACDNNRGNMNTMYHLYMRCGINNNKVLTKVLRLRVQEIWEYQSRFYRLYNKARAKSIDPNLYKVKKALAFMRIRNEHNDFSTEIRDWWETFIELDKSAKNKLLAKSRKRRRKKKTK